MCTYGIKCYRMNLEHFDNFDHPADHPLLLAPQPSLEPSPRIQFPKGRIDIDLTLASSDEEEGELWVSAFPAPASRMAIRINGLTMLQGTALGPQGVKAVRREILTGVGASTMAGRVEARQDLHAAAASASISTSNVTSTAYGGRQTSPSCGSQTQQHHGGRQTSPSCGSQSTTSASRVRSPYRRRTVPHSGRSPSVLARR